MDLSFAVQFFSAAHLLHNHGKLANKVYLMPEEINTKIAEIKLASIGAAIDTLTDKQRTYLGL